MVLELREVEGGSLPLRDQPPATVEEEEAEVEEAPRAGLPVDEDVLLEEVPAARPDHEDGGLLREPVFLPGLGRRVRDRPVDGVAEVDLPLDRVRPGRRVRVLEVGHEDARAGVQGVDHHLPVDGPRDLDAAVAEHFGDRRDLPLALPDLLRLREEVWKDAGVDSLLRLDAAGEELLAPRPERPRQGGDEAERLRREDLVVLRADRTEDLDPFLRESGDGGVVGHGGLLVGGRSG